MAPSTLTRFRSSKHEFRNQQLRASAFAEALILFEPVWLLSQPSIPSALGQLSARPGHCYHVLYGAPAEDVTAPTVPAVTE
jgi:hypothetical protein